MAKITFISAAGDEKTVEGTTGSVMELALQHNIKGIDGNCGGVCSCATCHVYVAPEYAAQTGEAGELEMDMLEFDDKTTEQSRLCCQIQISPELDGVVLTVAN